jgi:GTP:adenosylcobinamide-phosphate guanylyltransferase
MAAVPALFPKQRLTRQFDPILVIDGDHLDLHVIAHLADILDPVHVLVVQLADMA